MFGLNRYNYTVPTRVQRLCLVSTRRTRVHCPRAALTLSRITFGSFLKLAGDHGHGSVAGSRTVSPCRIIMCIHVFMCVAHRAWSQHVVVYAYSSSVCRVAQRIYITVRDLPPSVLT